MERLQREEFGILPREEIEEIVEDLVADKVEALPVAPITGRAKIDIAAIAAKIARDIAPQIRAEIRERDAEEEEEEAMSLFLLH
jgi:DNA-directed RNA polymerase subunit F